MPLVPDTIPYPNAGRASAWLRAGLLTGISDGLFAIVLSVFFYGSTFARLWQGVASVPFGRQALDWGTAGTMTGIVTHFCVAFTWSAVFLFLVMRLRVVRAALMSASGVAKVAAVYGPLIWMVMSLAVIPLLVQRPPTIGSRWWIQLVGHFPFVGLPVVACASAVARRSRSAINPVRGASAP